MTPVELRRLSARTNLLRAHVEFAATGERDAAMRALLDGVCALLAEAEQRLLAKVGA